MTSHKKNLGFTLIELLVVISIIGLLSSVVLAALSSARVKGKASAIQSEMIQVRNFMEINRDANGSYMTDFSYLNGSMAFPITGNAAYYHLYASQSDCSSISNLTQPQSQLNSICNAIVGNGGTLYIGGPNDGAWLSHPVYSIEVKLPSTNTYSCIGSRGNNSSGNGFSSSADYNAAGCLANP